MNAPVSSLLELTLAEAQKLHPALAAFMLRLDGGAAKPTKFLAQWLDELDEEAILLSGMDRDQIFEHIEALAQNAERLRAAPEILRELRILGGRDKHGGAEKLDLSLKPGDVVCVVGPTGSGKSRLLGDIECLAQGDTPSGRKILVNGAAPDAEQRWAASGKLVAQLSQNMNFVVDLTVGDFVALHADCRGVGNREQAAQEVIACANLLAGEKFSPQSSLTQLSGGQSRALMIADVALLSSSPIVLIDEIENAGIDRKQALDLLVSREKIVLLSTHDPILALMGDRRVVVAGGAVAAVLDTDDFERAQLGALERVDGLLMQIREKLRRGGRIDALPEAFAALGRANHGGA